MKILTLLSIVIIILVGCAAKVSPEAYSIRSVGQVNRSVAATVVSAREVSVAGTTGLGVNLGAGVGAVLGSTAGNNSRAKIVGAIGGAVVGGLAGATLEASGTKQNGTEYVVETENGNLITIVQGTEAVFSEKQKVLVLYGPPSRLIADPRDKR